MAGMSDFFGFPGTAGLANNTRLEDLRRFLEAPGGIGTIPTGDKIMEGLSAPGSFNLGLDKLSMPTFGSAEAAPSAPPPQPVAPPEAPGPMGGPRRVKTTPIAPGAMPGAVSEAQPPPGPAQAQPQPDGMRQQLMKMYANQMKQMSQPAKEESTREKIGRMLVNFGSGATAGANNISGRSVGPSTLEAFGTGSSSLAQGEVDEKNRKAGISAKRGKDARSMLEKSIGLHADLDKEQRSKSNSAFDRWAKKRDLEIKAKKTRDGLGDYLIGRIAPRLIASGTPAEELVPQIQQIMEAVRADPELASRLGLD